MISTRPGVFGADTIKSGIRLVDAGHSMGEDVYKVFNNDKDIGIAFGRRAWFGTTFTAMIRGQRIEAGSRRNLIKTIGKLVQQ